MLLATVDHFGNMRTLLSQFGFISEANFKDQYIMFYFLFVSSARF